MKKAVIVGAGAQATVIAGVLSKAKDVGSVLIGDIDLERARELKEVNGSKKISVCRMDASNKGELKEHFKKAGADLIVNAVIPQFNRQVLEAALEAGTNYIDMASNEIYSKKGVPIEQLEYADAWKKAGLSALAGGGGDPGLTNIMAKEAVENLDEVDRIMIKDYGIIDCDIPVALWSMRTYLEDLSLPTTIWEKGKPKEVPPFSGEEWYDFPAPLDVRGKVYYHDHEECVTIPLFCGKPVKYCDFKLGEPASDTWKFIIQDLGLMDEKPMAEGKAGKSGGISPRSLLLKKAPETLSPKKQIELYESGRLKSRLMLTCDVTGKKNGKPAHIKLWSVSPEGREACARIPGANDVSWATSVPASIFSLMLLRGQVKHTGVFPPEVFDKEERELFFKGIADWCITVHKQIHIEQ